MCLRSKYAISNNLLIKKVKFCRAGLTFSKAVLRHKRVGHPFFVVSQIAVPLELSRVQD